jgi:hypothetical protein
VVERLVPTEPAFCPEKIDCTTGGGDSCGYIHQHVNGDARMVGRPDEPDAIAVQAILLPSVKKLLNVESRLPVWHSAASLSPVGESVPLTGTPSAYRDTPQDDAHGQSLPAIPTRSTWNASGMVVGLRTLLRWFKNNFRWAIGHTDPDAYAPHGPEPAYRLTAANYIPVKQWVRGLPIDRHDGRSWARGPGCYVVSKKDWRIQKGHGHQKLLMRTCSEISYRHS